MPSYDQFIESTQPFNGAKLNSAVKIILIVLCTWAGLVNSSLVLISGAIFLLFTFLDKNIKSFGKLKTEQIKIYSICLFFLLSGVFSTLAILSKWANTNPVPYFIVSFIAIGTILLINIGIEKKPITRKLFEENIIWVLIFLIGLLVPFFKDPKGFNIDLVAGVLAIFYIAFLEIKKITLLFNIENKSEKQLILEETETAEIDELILREIFKVEKITKLIGFEICIISDEKIVIGTIVVDNKTTQEEIFEMKQKVKEILKKNSYFKSILEIQYEIEYDNSN